jgi:glyoxylase-like metal-dependent hydrolase (beta-lactamase superfamily II)
MLVVRHAVVGPFAANAYVAACSRTGEAVLVDPGGDVDRILALRDPGGYRVVRIFCTHGHVDHVAGAAEARERTGAPLQIHAGDEGWLAARRYAWNDEPQPQVLLAFGLLNLNPAPCSPTT